MRFAPIDQLRGLIIVLMTLDHARAFIHRSHPSEFWGQPLPDYQGDGLAFITRLVTHLCAPGFFLLMGVSMAMLSEKRWQREGTLAGVRQHFVVRGLVLIALQITIVNLAWAFGGLAADRAMMHYGVEGWPGEEGPIRVYFGVLACLGSVMIIGSLCLRWPVWWQLVAGVLCIVIPFQLFPDAAQVDASFAWWQRLLWLPGQVSFFHVRYPIFPWLGVGLLGLALGRIWVSRGRLPGLTLAGAGMVGTGAWLGLRLSQAWGEHHAPVSMNWIDLLNLTKYPPSPLFLLLSLSVLVVILGLFIRLNQTNKDRSLIPLANMGQATLFLYLAHLYLYGVLAHLFAAPGDWLRLAWVWLVGWMALYPLGLWWRGYKSRQSAGHWSSYL